MDRLEALLLCTLKRLGVEKEPVQGPLCRDFVLERVLLTRSPNVAPDRHASCAMSQKLLAAVNGAQEILGREYTVVATRQQREVADGPVEFSGYRPVAHARCTVTRRAVLFERGASLANVFTMRSGRAGM